MNPVDDIKNNTNMYNIHNIGIRLQLTAKDEKRYCWK